MSLTLNKCSLILLQCVCGVNGGPFCNRGFLSLLSLFCSLEKKVEAVGSSVRSSKCFS